MEHQVCSRAQWATRSSRLCGTEPACGSRLELAVHLNRYTDTPAWLHWGVSEPVEQLPASAHAGYLAVTPVATSKTLFLNLFISPSGRALYWENSGSVPHPHYSFNDVKAEEKRKTLHSPHQGWQGLSLNKVGEDPSVGCSLTPHALLSSYLTGKEALGPRISLLHDPMDNWVVVQFTMCPSAKLNTWRQRQEPCKRLPGQICACRSTAGRHLWLQLSFLAGQLPSVKTTPVGWAEKRVHLHQMITNLFSQSAHCTEGSWETWTTAYKEAIPYAQLYPHLHRCKQTN